MQLCSKRAECKDYVNEAEKGGKKNDRALRVLFVFHDGLFYR